MSMDPAQRFLTMLGIRNSVQSVSRPWAVTDTRWSEMLSDTEMQIMGQICPHRPYRKGDRVFRKGDEAHSLYVLIEGHVKLALTGWLGSERVLAVLGPDDFFGESFLTGASDCTSEAVCLSEQAIVCPINKDQFLQVAERLPGVALAFAGLLARRNMELEARLHAVTQPIQVRLARTMIELTRRFGQEQPDGSWSLQIELRHDEIASLANASRVSATQAISAWRAQELVLGTRGAYRVNVQGLEMLIEQLELEAME